jgi:hypothetical protein
LQDTYPQNIANKRVTWLCPFIGSNFFSIFSLVVGVELFCIAYVIDFFRLVCFLGLTGCFGFHDLVCRGGNNPLRWLRLRPLYLRSNCNDKSKDKSRSLRDDKQKGNGKGKGVGEGNSMIATIHP